MTSPLVSDVRSVILEIGLDPGVTEMLNDIIYCSVKIAIRALNESDLEELSEIMGFKRKPNGHLNTGDARESLKVFLKEHPAFRSRDPQQIVSNIKWFYTQNPLRHAQDPVQLRSRKFSIMKISLDNDLVIQTEKDRANGIKPAPLKKMEFDDDI